MPHTVWAPYNWTSIGILPKQNTRILKKTYINEEEEEETKQWLQ